MMLRLRQAEASAEPLRLDRLRCLRFDLATSAEFLNVILHAESRAGASQLPAAVRALLAGIHPSPAIAMHIVALKNRLMDVCELRAKRFAVGTYFLERPAHAEPFAVVAEYLRTVLGGHLWSHGLSGPLDITALGDWLMRFANGQLSFVELPAKAGSEEIDWDLNAEPNGLLFATLPEFLLAVAALHTGNERREWFDFYTVSLRALETMIARYAPAVCQRGLAAFEARLQHRARTAVLDDAAFELLRRRYRLLSHVGDDKDEKQKQARHLLSLHGHLIWSALRDQSAMELLMHEPAGMKRAGALNLGEFAPS